MPDKTKRSDKPNDPLTGSTGTVLIVAGFVLGSIGVWFSVRSQDRSVVSAGGESAKTTPAGSIWFRDVAVDRGIDFRHISGRGERLYMPEIMSGGGAWFDYDADGDLNLYLVQGGDVRGRAGALHPNKLYRNDGAVGFVDVTAAAGVGDTRYGMGCACGDFNNDGHVDLYVTNVGANVLYRNNGDGTFSDVSNTSGIRWTFGNGLGVVGEDVNNDGWVDLCVANDETANQLWINQQDGTFRDEALIQGIAYSGDGSPEAGMGIDARDVDGGDDIDILMTHFRHETNTLYLQENGFFMDYTLQAGLGATRPFTGFGTALVDLNNDGLIDLYTVNGRVTTGSPVDGSDDPYAEPNQLFVGTAPGAFVEVFPRGETTTPLVHSSRGAAFGDFDNDGDIDVVVVNRDGPVYLLENVCNNGNHWITLDVRNVHGAPAIGATVVVTVSGKRRRRTIRTAFSYCASNDPRAHFRLHTADLVDDIEVIWPDGTTQRFGSLAVDRVHVLQCERPTS